MKVSEEDGRKIVFGLVISAIIILCIIMCCVGIKAFTRRKKQKRSKATFDIQGVENQGREAADEEKGPTKSADEPTQHNNVNCQPAPPGSAPVYFVPVHAQHVISLHV